MKSVKTTATVARSPQEVFEFLDLFPNHARFLDHYLTEWTFSGPERGVGAKARARASALGSQDWFEFVVVDSEAPSRNVEEGTSAGGKRKTRGSYHLEEAPGGGTKINFELEFLEVPRSERIAPFLTRAFAKRVNGKAIRRLVKLLED
jgi:ribosome-associated toxin RatA of RatAB toxin-antitoxin module